MEGVGGEKDTVLCGPGIMVEDRYCTYSTYRYMCQCMYSTNYHCIELYCTKLYCLYRTVLYVCTQYRQRLICHSHFRYGITQKKFYSPRVFISGGTRANWSTRPETRYQHKSYSDDLPPGCTKYAETTSITCSILQGPEEKEKARARSEILWHR